MWYYDKDWAIRHAVLYLSYAHFFFLFFSLFISLMCLFSVWFYLEFFLLHHLFVFVSIHFFSLCVCAFFCVLFLSVYIFMTTTTITMVKNLTEECASVVCSINDLVWDEFCLSLAHVELLMIFVDYVRLFRQLEILAHHHIAPNLPNLKWLCRAFHRLLNVNILCTCHVWVLKGYAVQWVTGKHVYDFHDLLYPHQHLWCVRR